MGEKGERKVLGDRWHSRRQFGPVAIRVNDSGQQRGIQSATFAEDGIVLYIFDEIKQLGNIPARKVWVGDGTAGSMSGMYV